MLAHELIAKANRVRESRDEPPIPAAVAANT